MVAMEPIWYQLFPELETLCMFEVRFLALMDQNNRGK
jgi:hypothetical protein